MTKLPFLNWLLAAALVDIFRVSNGKLMELMEHWELVQEDVPADKTPSANSPVQRNISIKASYTSRTRAGTGARWTR